MAQFEIDIDLCLKNRKVFIVTNTSKTLKKFDAPAPMTSLLVEKKPVMLSHAPMNDNDCMGKNRAYMKFYIALIFLTIIILNEVNIYTKHSCGMVGSPGDRKKCKTGIGLLSRKMDDKYQNIEWLKILRF